MVGRKIKKFRLKTLKQVPLKGAAKRRKAGKRAIKRIRRAFPLATRSLK